MAYSYFTPQVKAGDQAKKAALLAQADELSQRRQTLVDNATKQIQQRNAGTGIMSSSRTNDPYHNVVGGKEAMDLNGQIAALRQQAGGTASDADRAWDAAQGMTAGVADQLMNDPRIEAALSQLQQGAKAGPYTDRVQQQLISRNADASAHAEGVNADELRNQLAARGVGPNDPGYQSAMREMTQTRQANNLAFAGDTRSNATLQNYGAQQQAAQALANTRLNQVGQAQQGYSQAANMQANRQFSNGRTAFANTGTIVSNPVASSTGTMTQTVAPAATTPASAPAVAPKTTTPRTTSAASQPTPGTPEHTAWYRARYGQGTTPGMSGTGRDAQGNLINPTPVSPAAPTNYATPAKPASAPPSYTWSNGPKQFTNRTAFAY